MKLLEMKRLVSEEDKIRNGGRNQGQIDYMVKFEDSYEDDMYGNSTGFGDMDDREWIEFNKWLKDNLGIADDDVHTYLMSSEQEPEIGETIELDNMKWERIA